MPELTRAQARELLALYAGAKRADGTPGALWDGRTGAPEVGRMVRALAYAAGLPVRHEGRRLVVRDAARRDNPAADPAGFDGYTLRVRIDPRTVPDLREAVRGLRGVTEEAFVLLEAIEAAAGVSADPAPARARRPAVTRAHLMTEIERHHGSITVAAQALGLSRKEAVALRDSPEPTAAERAKAEPLTAERVRAALLRHAGSMKAASAELGIARSTLRDAVARFGLGEFALQQDGRGTRPGRELLVRTLREADWSPSAAATMLSLPRSTVNDAIRFYGLTREGDEEARAAISDYAPGRAKNPPDSEGALVRAMEVLGIADPTARRTNPPPNAGICATRFYHGTSDDRRGRRILAEGIQPREVTLVKAPSAGGVWAPQRGRVYLSHEAGFAQIYALGGDFAGHDIVGWDETYRRADRRYGWVFVVDGRSLCDVEPDEDAVGRAVWLAHRQSQGEDVSQASATDWPRLAAALHASPETAAVILDTARHGMTKLQFRGATRGEYRSFAGGGKRMLRSLPVGVRLWLVENGAGAAHAGGLRPAEAWRLDKLRVRDLRPDGSNLFDVAERVA